MQTAPPKKRSKIKLAGLILFALGGWGAAVITGMGLGAAKNQAVKDQQEAQVWKAKAGKAYTELLLAKAGKAEQITIPAGSLLQCVSTDGSAPKVDCGGFILPPADY
ncbi:hypothetical protein NYB23_004699 [Salmonella enterica]|nr:hypothetical protein [Salmonella enterica]HEE6752148.1 hypothetical protein [Pseudomonas aeruginosa]